MSKGLSGLDVIPESCEIDILILHTLNEFLFNLRTQIHLPQAYLSCLIVAFVGGQVNSGLWTSLSSPV